MMPNGGHANNLWGGSHQWYQPAVHFTPDQMQNFADINGLHLMASHQFSTPYATGAIPTWNAYPQWTQQWQANFQTNWGNVLVHNAQPPPPPPPPTNAPPDPKPLPPPPPDETPSNSIGITEEEKSFDIQFKEWEDKFQLWKEENKNHPDKEALALYETQWKSWRGHLIQNREKLRSQREEYKKQHSVAPRLISDITDTKLLIDGAKCNIPPSSKNKEIGNNFQHKNNLHHFQTSSLPGQSLVNLPQNNLYSSQAVQASIDISTHLLQPGHSSKQRLLETYSDRLDSSTGGVSGSSYKTLHYELNPISRLQRDEYRDQPSQHSNLNRQSFHSSDESFRPSISGPSQTINNQDHLLSRASQHHAIHGYRDSWPRQQDFISPTNEQPYENTQLRQLVPSFRQRESSMPKVKTMIESSQHSSNYIHPKYHDGLDDFQNSETSTETAADVFRRRAMRGKTEGQRFAPFKLPELFLDRTVTPDCGSRARIEERLAEHAVVQISANPRRGRELDVSPSERSYGSQPQNSVSVMEPIVFEYDHRSRKDGNSSYDLVEPFTIDYSHGKRVNTGPSESTNSYQQTDTESDHKPHHPSSIEKELPEQEVEKSLVKTTPTPLFPSAAAIVENSLLLPQLKAEPTVESLKLPQPKLLDSPKHDLAPVEMEVVMIEDLLLPPGRYGRPSKIVLIIRGLPGSGKSHIARLIKEKEVSMGGSTPRILSIDDYYLVDDGCSPVPWQEDQEEQYRQSLMKSLKKNLDDSYFSFIIVDALHAKKSHVLDVHNTARCRSFAVFLVDLIGDLRPGATRKCTEQDLEKMKKEWQPAPEELPRLDIRWLLQETVNERTTTSDVVVDTSTAAAVLLDEDSRGSSNGTPAVSKWEMMEQTEEKLDRLDGIVKRKSEKPTSMEDWLQSGLPDDYDQRKCIEGKKRVRWADVEEKIQQKKIRDLGFVVGQTDWSRMTDPTFGESALTETKYI